MESLLDNILIFVGTICESGFENIIVFNDVVWNIFWLLLYFIHLSLLISVKYSLWEILESDKKCIYIEYQFPLLITHLHKNFTSILFSLLLCFNNLNAIIIDGAHVVMYGN